MRKFYKGVVNHKALIIVIYSILFVFCFFAKDMVLVDYDMNDYLPEDSPSTVALDVMDKEFDGGIPNARVMVQNVTVPKALEYKEKLEKVDGVSSVTWLDDAVDITEPLEMQDKDNVENYYKDNNALFSVTIDEAKNLSAVSDIRKIIGNDNKMSGSAVSTAVATNSTVSEIAKISVIAVLFVLFVLAITTTSWIEPLVIFLGIGVAVIINSGSNIIFGQISFVTNAAGSILQIAVSLDYSVFLIHRYNECRKIYPNNKEAMIEALTKSTSSILSSGLTTVIGFLALCLMQFQIGSDLGRALAKGIAISLVTVFVLMPVVILLTTNLMDKTSHRRFMPSFKTMGKFVTKIMIPMVIVFFVAIVPSFLASNKNDFYYGASHIFGTNTQLGSDTKDIENIFDKSDTYVLLVSKGDKATEKKMSDDIQKLDEVSGIISYVDTVGESVPESYLDKDTLSKLESNNYSRMVISANTDYEGEETFDLIKNIRSIAEKYYPDKWYLAGQGVSTYDLMDTITSDMTKVNFVAIGAVFVVLLLTMKNLALPIILVLGIETAIWINLSIPYFSGTTIFYISYLIISSIQLGATVDYAILFTERYKENRLNSDKKQSIIDTISQTAVSILTSGSALTVVGFLLGYISTHGLLSQLGFFLGKGTLCSLAIVFFVLPGLLYVFDKTFIKGERKKKYEKVK
ncbi:RND family transporter [Ruminococcus sp.]|uniref:efflux RND transporter permease subunit n=1 Tax=Ruminococcus sp. TaxID=41978 RepID=UPI00258A0A40|nr:efflux RND transporter permease subunit [Ruminococcus sp.]MEE3439673.1 efflux RND transporter permease subunit [Ruminococcus sp.]